MSGPEERQRAVELYSATPRPTAQVVRPRWYGSGGRAPGLSDQAVTGTLAGKGFPVCWPYGQTGGADAFLEVASQPFAGGTISRCWHILFTR